MGGLAGATLATHLAARRAGASSRLALDALAPALGVLVLVGRVGCLLAGCCFGRPATGAWAIAYAPGTRCWVEHARRGWIDAGSARSLAVHPVQIDEALLGAMMIGVGVIGRRRLPAGGALAAVVALYAAGRFALELLRDDPRGLAGPWTIAQWLAIAALLATGAAWGARRRRHSG
jgi:phosphatidylglycerol:prolipoprotein diacylglycerol transferase